MEHYNVRPFAPYLVEQLRIIALQNHAYILAACSRFVPGQHWCIHFDSGSGFEDIQRRLPDISKARAAFGFQPGHDLTRILADVISEFRAGLEDESRFSAVPHS
jgi:nucleoside-diphosphate-sugar epimerase